MPPNSAQDAGLGQLTMAPELLIVLFETIDDYRDAAALCMTNKTLWSIGNSFVLKGLKRDMTEWEGDRLACIGDYIEFLPDGVLTPAEQAELDKGKTTAEVGRCRSKTQKFMDFYTFVDFRYGELTWTAKYEGQQRDKEIVARLSPYERRAYTLLTQTPAQRYSQSEVLCNVTQRQYVRTEGLVDMLLAAKLEGAHLTEGHSQSYWGHYPRSVDIGDVLLSRICWSDDPSVSMAYDGGIHQGVWAGDRFVVVNSVGGFQERFADAEDWTDVSEEVGEEILDIYRSQYGDQWPN